MKKVIIITLTIISQTLCVSQVAFDEYFERKLDVSRIKNEEFKELLRDSPDIGLPYNLSKLLKFFNNEKKYVKQKDLESDLVKKYFNYSEEELVHTYTEIGSGYKYTEKRMFSIDQSYYIDNTFIVVYMSEFCITDDPNPFKDRLYIFDLEGKLIDSQLVGGIINSSEIYDSFIIIDETHFKTYFYSAYKPNVKSETYFNGPHVRYNDQFGYRSQCVITDYEITSEGKIIKTNTSEPVLLYEDFWLYMQPNIGGFDGDPMMNKNWKEYIKNGYKWLDE